MQLPDYVPFDSWWAYFTLLLAATTIGLGKAGVKGGLLFTVPLLAAAFGGKSAAAVLVPLLLVGDAFAIYRYGKHVKWNYVRSLIPAAIMGILLAVLVGEWINDATFGTILSLIVLASVVVLLYLERYPIDPKKMERPAVATSAGLLGGFTTMIGNVGGPVMSIYLLSTRLPKLEFLGTGAYFFLIVNLTKLPFHIWVWKKLDLQMLWQDLWALPAVLLGFYLGLWLVMRMSEQFFRYLIMGLTCMTALGLLLS